VAIVMPALVAGIHVLAAMKDVDGIPKSGLPGFGIVMRRKSDQFDLR
jgi:hypothetical protein